MVLTSMAAREWLEHIKSAGFSDSEIIEFLFTANPTIQYEEELEN